MKIDVVDLYYFSGTGNTYLVVKEMCKTFRKCGIEADMYKIEDSNPENINVDHTIGLGFPIAELSTYEFVWNFIKALPQTEGTKVFMVDTLGGISGGIVGPVRKIVKEKGYKPIGACEIQMPTNIFYIQDKETNEKKIKKGLNRAQNYAKALIKGKAKWKKDPILYNAIYYTSMLGLKFTETNLNQKMLHLTPDKEKCNKCGTCVELCPINNIEMKEGEYPENLMHCQYCLRCVSLCPKKAISCPINYKGKTYAAVKAKELM
ncbi:EFR1 family ferrodoxin [Methanobacterium sp. ACI-7]|uniref:EFR1 family ferrodoxin n=1 Tax=unclassified Methanobacterium TaxID=2627676 RepID=UPI0039C3AE94